MLGSGTSSGVPRIGNDWGDCDPGDRRNRRRRVSVLIEHGGATVLIDTSPDLREQLLDAAVSRIDAVLFTHDHADHAHGIDDLRQVFHVMKVPVACYATDATWGVLKRRFDYVFDGTAFYPPTCIAHPLPPTLAVGAMTIGHFAQSHGNIESTGYRFDAGGAAFAYSTDVKALGDAAGPFLRGLDLWIVDALRRTPHPTHSHLTQTLDWIARYAPKSAVLTHLDQSMDYVTLAGELPKGVEPGFDGWTMTLGG